MTPKRLELLDYTRFFSAIAVVLFHYTYNGIANGKVQSISHIPELIVFTQYGFFGVQLFFMISGYVIFYSALNRTPSQFTVSRALRIYPCYFLGVLLTSIVTYLWGGELLSITLHQILANLAFLHVPLSIPFIDGVYWTLVYEAFFYFVVLVLLLLGAQSHMYKIFLAWPYMMLLLHLLGFDNVPFFSGYFTYFAAGAIYAVSRMKHTSLVTVAILISAFLTVNTAVETVMSHPSKSLHLSPAVITVTILFFHCIFLLQNTKPVQNLRLPGSRLASSLTYPLYLIHAHCGYIALNWLADDSNKSWFYPLLVFACLLVSYCLYYLSDIKLFPAWKRFFETVLGKPIEKLESIISSDRASVRRNC